MAPHSPTHSSQSRQKPLTVYSAPAARKPVWFRLCLAAAGIGLLIWLAQMVYLQPQHLWTVVLSGLFIVINVIFSISLLSGEANLMHVVTLGIGILYGPAVAAWGATLGVLLGYLIRRSGIEKDGDTSLPQLSGLDSLAMLGMHHIALLVSLLLFGWIRPASSFSVVDTSLLVRIVFTLLTFAGIHLALYLANAFVLGCSINDLRHASPLLALVELLPIPFVLLAVMSFPVIGLGALVLLGGIPVLLQVLIFAVNNIRMDLERRARELATLSQISQALRSPLDLDKLLAEIHTQVSSLFGVENFYIALFNEDEQEIWYPLAVKNSQRVHWPPRSLADRLTDRVIRDREPILVPFNARAALERIGLPTGEDAPAAWMGVPLIASEHVIGCLGVFSYLPKVVFSAADIHWLSTLSGQVSAAIESTLRYQQAQRRADLALSQRVNQLSILEAVGRELAAAIRSDRLLDIILGYALEVTESSWGSIMLYDPLEKLLLVKALRGYQNGITSMSADAGVIGRAARTGQRIYVPDIRHEPDYVDLTGGVAHAQLCVPLVHEGRVLGVLTLEHPNAHAYSASDQAFVSQLAAQATIAVVNAELYAQAQERLSELAAVLNSVGEGFLVIDATGQITLANQAIQTLTNFPVSEYIGRRLLELPESALATLGFSRHQAETLISALKLGQVPASPRATIRISETAPERILERTSFPVWDRRGRASGWMVVLRNLTEEFQLAQAKELITETVVHDLRSPASAVLGALDVLEDALPKDQYASDEVVMQAIQVARRGAHRVLALIESMLEISRLQAGKIEISLSAFSLRPLVAGLINDFRPEAMEYGIILRNEISDDLPPVRADLSKTTRVITNLLDNAVKFTPAGGQIILSAMPPVANVIMVQVSDTGPGVPEEYREKIFERFSQIPGLPGRRRGSGLGLTFCQLALEAQGGKIWVEPRPGGGSTFAFTLPVAQ